MTPLCAPIAVHSTTKRALRPIARTLHFHALRLRLLRLRLPASRCLRSAYTLQMPTVHAHNSLTLHSNMSAGTHLQSVDVDPNRNRTQNKHCSCTSYEELVRPSNRLLSSIVQILSSASNTVYDSVASVPAHNAALREHNVLCQ